MDFPFSDNKKTLNKDPTRLFEGIKKNELPHIVYVDFDSCKAFHIFTIYYQYPDEPLRPIYFFSPNARPRTPWGQKLNAIECLSSDSSTLYVIPQ